LQDTIVYGLTDHTPHLDLSSTFSLLLVAVPLKDLFGGGLETIVLIIAIQTQRKTHTLSEKV
jgi:hypothetical protein